MPAVSELFQSLSWTAIVVLVPLAVGTLAVPMGRRAVHLGLPGALLAAAAAVMAASEVLRAGGSAHAIGGWPAPLGIRLQVDGFSGAMLIMTAVVAGAVAVFARIQSESPAGPETRAGFAFWPLLFFLWAAMNAVFVGADFFNLYVALEMLTLTAVALVALEGKPETLAAAMRYLTFALLGSLSYLLGVVLLYAGYGTLDMDLLRGLGVGNHLTVIAAALMTAGLLAKTALFPLHGWLAPAHAGAPAPASALLSALVVKASFYIVVRLWFDVLPMAATVELTWLLGALGGAAILFGSLSALRQSRLKLIVAYSTVAQLGYLFLIFPLAGGGGDEQPWAATAWTGAIFHALAHAPAKAAMFLAAGLMIRAAGHDRLDGLAGMAQALPVTVFAFALAAVSIMGLPPSGGFTAKYLLLTSALAGGVWWAAVVMLVGGGLAAWYLFRVLNRTLTEPAEGMVARFAAVPRAPQIVALLLALVSILLGLLSAGPYEFLQRGRAGAAAEGLA
jgi:multicomponent Na+:H+ antiporter subunit D